MDYFAHGLWSYIAFHKKKEVLWAVFFGLLPDTIAWVPYFLYRLFAQASFGGKPVLAEIPDWVQFLYGFSHSIFTCAAVFLIVYIVRRKIPYFMWSWPLLHIAIDIPTHRADFLPTPFLWPFSDYAFPGFSWSEPWFLITNYTLIIGSLFYIRYRKKK